MSDIPKEDIRAIAKLEALMDTVMEKLQEISAEQKEQRRENAEMKQDIRELKNAIKRLENCKPSESHVIARIFANNWIRIIAMFGGVSAVSDVLYRILKAIH